MIIYINTSLGGEETRGLNSMFIIKFQPYPLCSLCDFREGLLYAKKKHFFNDQLSKVHLPISIPTRVRHERLENIGTNLTNRLPDFAKPTRNPDRKHLFSGPYYLTPVGTARP